MKKITTPLSEKEIKGLKAGEEVALSGIIYTARDQAHKRLIQDLAGGRRLPFDLKGAIIYYCGPTQRPKGKVIGSCGPTTSRRMDEFTPRLLKAGLRGAIGKGGRSQEVVKAIKKHQAVYFITYAGCGALLSKYVKKAAPYAFAELGPEAIYKLEVKDFPLIVGIDCKGGKL
ncbi:MAG: FumA C-terminus/TtdB family hydratase beta subunit [Candidatus Omnitrophota bacterium]